VKIVVLDGYTLNPGDLSWENLQKLGDCNIYDRTAPSEILHRIDGVEIVLTNKTPLNRETLNNARFLKYIGVLATGYNIVDVKTARAKNIPVTNVPTYGTQSVAQLVFSHILNIYHNVGDHAISVKKGDWTLSKDFCYWQRPIVEVYGKTIGLIGLGRIGLATAKIAQAFGMNVLAYDVDANKIPKNIRAVSLKEIFEQSDIVSLHCPLTEENTNIINATNLKLMKKSAILINTSRGPLVDEQALTNALNSGQISAAGLDVLSAEPPLKENPLFSAKNCFITPHIAWATKEARQRLLETAIKNVENYLSNLPSNVVNM
jgi:glycerate dehydrogenase